MGRYGISEISVVPMRIAPSEESEMVSQILFGEHFEILDEDSKWFFVRLSFDKSEGWIDKKMVTELNEHFIEEINKGNYVITNELISKISCEHSSTVQYIVCCSILPLFNVQEKTFKISNKKYKYHGKLRRKPLNIRKSIISTASQYLNSPYLWGGRMPLGIDCSGLTQNVFKINNINLPRNAHQQANIGETVNFFHHARPADLAFFDNEQGNIIHTGIIYDKNKIIHASGKVRIDYIDHQGIYNTELKRYTHKLRIIKTLFD